MVCFLITSVSETGKEWKILHDRLLRIAFLSDSQLKECPDLKEYSAILVDEAHLLAVDELHRILKLSEKHPVIFSSDDEDMISDEEMDRTMIREIEHLPDIQSFHLTNRIRTNAELSAIAASSLAFSCSFSFFRSSMLVLLSVICFVDPCMLSFARFTWLYAFCAFCI